MPRDLVLYALAAISLALAYPPFRFGFLAYWAFIPFLLLLEDKSYGSAMRWSYGIGLIVSVTVLCDNLWLSLPSVITFVLLQPLYFALFGFALILLRIVWPASFRDSRTGYLTFVPLLWAAMEYLRSLNEPAAPSLKLGYTQEYFRQLVQYGPSTLIYAMSAWVVALNVILLGMWRLRESFATCVGLLALLLVLCALPYLYHQFAQPRWRDWQEQQIEAQHETALWQRNSVRMKLL